MKVCKVRWRRALGTSLLLLALLALQNLLSPEEQQTRNNPQDRTRVTSVAFVGDKLRSLYVRKANPQAGLRSIKVVNEDYVKTSVDSKRSSIPAEDEPAGNELVFYEDPDTDSNTGDLQDQPNREFQTGDFDYESWQQAENETREEFPTLSTSLSPVTSVLWSSSSSPSTTGSRKNTRHFSLPFLLVPRASRPVDTLLNLRNQTVVEDGLFWSERLEDLLPSGVSDEEVAVFLERSHNLPVKSVQSPTWNRCGRPKNQFVVFSDGTQACARYRAPHDYLVQGELMSFYLARLLGITNVPTVSLSSVSKWLLWPSLNHSLAEAGWAPNATVALIQWINGLDRDRMPVLILNALSSGQTLNPSSSQLKKLDDRQLVELVQWSDLILFDYITGNYDRVASMQDAADREQRPAIMQETIHNLVKSRETQSLWLIDNESGLLDSYSLLYGQGSLEPNRKESRFVKFHREMLNTVCIFRRKIFQRVRWLKNMRNRAVKFLVTLITKHEPLFKRLPSVFKNKEFVTNFHRRIVHVYEHMKQCQVL